MRLPAVACVGDASVLVPPFLGGDPWGSAGQVSDYLCSLPSNMEQTGRAFRWRVLFTQHCAQSVQY